MSARPDFFIAGAGKCGTTALFNYLSRHPRVFLPANKEPKFFCSDLKANGAIRDRAAYEALFAPAPADFLTGDASTLYLYSRIAIERLMAHNRNAKVIVMLRYPVDAAHSRHSGGWNHGYENIENFEAAWDAQVARMAGERMPPNYPDPLTLQYGQIYRYAPQVRRVLEHVPKEQRHFIVYEEFFCDPATHFGEVLRFLDLSPLPDTSFAVVNPATGPRSAALERALRGPPKWLKALYAPVRPLVHAMGLRPATMVRELNSVPRQKLPLRPDFRARLDSYFAADIEELEVLLGRDLWRDRRPARQS